MSLPDSVRKLPAPGRLRTSAPRQRLLRQQQRRARRSRFFHPAAELLESRELLASVPFQWEFQGPDTIREGAVVGMTDQQRPVIGAITSIVPHQSERTLFVGTSNGGVWRTYQADAANPLWVPLTDNIANQLSLGTQDPYLPLSITALAGDFSFDVSPEEGGAPQSRLVASLGVPPGSHPDGGLTYGLLWSENGGQSWTHIADQHFRQQNISDIAFHGSTMFLAANHRGVPNSAVEGGSLDGGVLMGQLIDGNWEFTFPGGDVLNDVSSLVADRNDPGIIYAAELPAVVDGAPTGGSIWRYDSRLGEWTNLVQPGSVLDSLIGVETKNIQLSFGAHGQLYVGVVNANETSVTTTIARSGNPDETAVVWEVHPGPRTPFALPTATGGLIQDPANTQYFSIEADPNNEWIVYVGGDRQPTAFEENYFPSNHPAPAFKSWGFVRDSEGLIDLNPGNELQFRHRDNDEIAAFGSDFVEFALEGSTTEEHHNEVVQQYRGTESIANLETWEDWGVPANARVTSVQITEWEKSVRENRRLVEHQLSFDLVTAWKNPDDRDAVYPELVLDGTLIDVELETAKDIVPDESEPRFRIMPGSETRAVLPEFQASNTPIQLRIQYRATVDLNDALFFETPNVALGLDNIRLMITYEVQNEWPNSIGATSYTGRLFRGNWQLDPESGASLSDMWQQVTHEPRPGGPVESWMSAPHAGSLDLAFLNDGTLIEADAGGIYRLPEPGSYNTGVAGGAGRPWNSANGNLANTEFNSVDWDPHADRIVGGTPELGLIRQVTADSPKWLTVPVSESTVRQAFTGTHLLAVRDATRDLDIAPSSWYYTADDHLRTLSRARVTRNGDVTARQDFEMYVNLPLADVGDSALDVVDPPDQRPRSPVVQFSGGRTDKFLIGTRYLYEAEFSGPSLIRLEPLNGIVRLDEDTLTPEHELGLFTALAYGTASDPDVIHAATSTGQLYFRPAGVPSSDRSWLGNVLSVPTAEGGQRPHVVDLVVDPRNSARVYVLTSADVYQVDWVATPSGGYEAQLQFLPDGFTRFRPTDPAISHDFRSIEFIPAGEDPIAYDTLVVGGRDGIYALRGEPTLAFSGFTPNSDWIDLSGTTSHSLRAYAGANADALPGAIVTDLQFVRDNRSLSSTDEAVGNQLLVGTRGRGAWSVGDADRLFTYSVRVGETQAADLRRLTRGTGYDLVSARTSVPGTDASQRELRDLHVIRREVDGDTVFDIATSADPGAPILVTLLPSGITENIEGDEIPAPELLFTNTGRTYFSPNHVGDGLGPYDADPQAAGYQGQLELTFQYADLTIPDPRLVSVVLEVLPPPLRPATDAEGSSGGVCVPEVPVERLSGTESDLASRVASGQLRTEELSPRERNTVQLINELRSTGTAIQGFIRTALATTAALPLPGIPDTLLDVVNFDLNALARKLLEPVTVRPLRAPATSLTVSTDDVTRVRHPGFDFLVRFDNSPPLTFTVDAFDIEIPDGQSPAWGITRAINAALGSTPIPNPDAYFLTPGSGDPPNYADILEAVESPMTGGPGVAIKTRYRGLAEVVTLTTLRVTSTPFAPQGPFVLRQGLAFDVTLQFAPVATLTTPAPPGPATVTFPVVVPTSLASDNRSLEQLASDLNTAFAASLVELEGQRRQLSAYLYAFVDDGHLAFAPVDARITAIGLANRDSGGASLGVEAIGFRPENFLESAAPATTTGLGARQVAARPVVGDNPWDPLLVLAEELLIHQPNSDNPTIPTDYLNVLPQSLRDSLEYDSENDILYFNFVVDADAANPLFDLNFLDDDWTANLADIDLGPLHLNGVVHGKIDVDVDLNLRFGLNLGEMPDALVINDQTLLAELNDGDGIDIVVAKTGRLPVDERGRLSPTAAGGSPVRQDLTVILNRGLPTAQVLNLTIPGDLLRDNTDAEDLADDLNEVFADRDVDDLIEAEVTLIRDLVDETELPHITIRGVDESVLTLVVDAPNLGFAPNPSDPLRSAETSFTHHDLELRINDHVVLIDLDEAYDASGTRTVTELIKRFNEQARGSLDGTSETRWLAELAVRDDGLGLTVISPPRLTLETPTDYPDPITLPESEFHLSVRDTFDVYGSRMRAAEQLDIAKTAGYDCQNTGRVVILGGPSDDDLDNVWNRLFIVAPEPTEPPNVEVSVVATLDPIDWTAAISSLQLNLTSVDTDDADTAPDPLVAAARLPIRLVDPGAGLRADGRITIEELFSLDLAIEPTLGVSATVVADAPVTFGDTPTNLLDWLPTRDGARRGGFQWGPGLLDFREFSPDTTPPEIILPTSTLPDFTSGATPRFSAATMPDSPAAEGERFGRRATAEPTLTEQMDGLRPLLIYEAVAGAISVIRHENLLNSPLPVLDKSINELTSVFDTIITVVEDTLLRVDADRLSRIHDDLASGIANLDQPLETKSPLFDALRPIATFLATEPDRRDLTALIAASGHLRKAFPTTLHKADENFEDDPEFAALRSLLRELESIVPKFNNVVDRLERAVNDHMPYGATFQFDVVDYDSDPERSPGFDAAMVMGITLDAAKLAGIESPYRPSLPGSDGPDGFGPLTITTDVEFAGNAQLHLAVGVRLDGDFEPFVLVGSPNELADGQLPPTYLRLEAGIAASGDVGLQLGSYPTDVVRANVQLALQDSAQHFDLIAQPSTTRIFELDGVPAGPSNALSRLVMVEVERPTGNELLDEGQIRVDGQLLELDASVDLTDATGLVVYYLNSDQPVPSDATSRPATLDVFLARNPELIDNTIGAVRLYDFSQSDALDFELESNGLLSAQLDVEVFNNRVENAVTFVMALDHFDEPRLVVDNEGLAGLLRNVDFDLLTIVDGIDAFLGLLEEGLNSQVMAELPLIGDDFDSAGNFVGDLRSDFVRPLRDKLATIGGDFATVEENLREFIFDVLSADTDGPAGPDQGLGLLVDRNGVNDIDPTDIHVELDGDSFEFKVRLKLEDSERLFSFASGLDGLPISGQGGVDIGWSFLVDLGFGIDARRGFYLIPNTVEEGPDMTLTVGANLAPEMIGGREVPASVSLDLFGLQVVAEDAADRGGTGLNAITYLDFNNEVAREDRIYFSDLSRRGFDDVLTLGGDASARLNLNFDVGIDSDLPSLYGELNANWTLHFDTGEMTSADFAIRNISLDLGDFLSEHVRPAIEVVDDVLAPVRPVLNLLTQAIPVVSQLAGEPVTLLDLVEEYAPSEYTAAAKFVKLENQIQPVLNLLDNAVQGDAVRINFGDLALPNPEGMAESGWTDSDFTGVIEDAASAIESLGEQLGVSPNPRLAKALSLIQSPAKEQDGGGLGLKLRFLEPQTIFRFLLGQTRDLSIIEWDDLQFAFKVGTSQAFPILPWPPLNLATAISAGISLDFSVGFDTRGFRTGNFLDGFYFGDRSDVSVGDDIAEVRFDLGAALGLALGVPGLSVGIQGEMNGALTANWRDEDENGKIYLDELTKTLVEQPQCLFDLDTELLFGLAVTWEIFLLDGKIRVTEPTGFRDSNRGSCPAYSPAHLSTEGETLSDGKVAEAGTLILHAGPLAGLRGRHATDVSEHFVVTQLDDGVFQVDGIGLTQSYGGVQRIYFDGGMGNDILELIVEGRPDAAIQVPVTAYGGFGDDSLRGGNLADYLDGGAGDDTLAGGDGPDWMVGGPGRDVIHAGPGEDHVYGGSGSDTIYGDAGGDYLFGEAGNDRVDGGDANDLSSDIVDGGQGNDLVVGGPGVDFVLGGWGNDVVLGHLEGIVAAPDEDQLEGGPDDDFLCGTDGANRIYGGISDWSLLYMANELGSRIDVPAGGPRISACEAATVFTPAPTSRITGSLVLDTNLDGAANAADLGQPGVRIELYDEHNALVATTVTGPIDLNGDGTVEGTLETSAYAFTDLEPGTYAVVQVLPDNQVQVSPLANEGHTVTLDDGLAATGLDFVNQNETIIEGFKWEDLNGNGQFDDGEPPLAGVEVFAFQDVDGNGVVSNFEASDSLTYGAATTDETGRYQIRGLSPGTYLVREIEPPHLRQTYPAQYVYSNDFETAVGPEWFFDARRAQTVRNYPGAISETILGRYGNESIYLQLNDLPAHDSLTLEFDLHIFGNWEGNTSRTDCQVGELTVPCEEWQQTPDWWRVSSITALGTASVFTPLLVTTFSNTLASQSYPDPSGQADHPARSGAATNNAYGFQGIIADRLVAMDSMYRLRLTFEHADEMVRFQFGAGGLIPFADVDGDGENDVGWGLDNVVLRIGDNGHRVTLGPGERVSGIDFGNQPTTRSQLTIVATPTPVAVDGRATAPADTLSSVSEWESYYAEIWVESLTGSPGIQQAISELRYQPFLATAREIEWGPTFRALSEVTIDDQAGVVRGIRAVPTSLDAAAGSPVLLARVRFAPGPEDDVLSTSSPTSLHLRGSTTLNLDVTDANGNAVDVSHAFEADAVVYPESHDFDEDGAVGQSDFEFFSRYFGRLVASDSDVPAWIDFDHTGRIDVGDFSFFATSMNRSRPPVDSVTGESRGASPQFTAFGAAGETGDSPTLAMSAPPEADTITLPLAPSENEIRMRGVKWDDRNLNGQRDVGEPGVPGVTIYVDLNENGVLDPYEPYDVTNESGQYLIHGVYNPGNYLLREVPSPGTQPSAPRTPVLTAVSGDEFQGYLHSFNYDAARGVSSLIGSQPLTDSEGRSEALWIGLSTHPVTGELYGLTPTALYRIDPSTARLQRLVGLSERITEGDLAFHPVTHELYVLDGGNRNLSKIDVLTGVVTRLGVITFNLGEFGAATDPSAMAFDAQSQLYILTTNDLGNTSTGRLWKLNLSGSLPASLAAIRVVDMPNALGAVSGMTFSGEDGRLLLTVGQLAETLPNRLAAGLYSVSLVTGTPQLLASHGRDTSGLAWTWVPSPGQRVRAITQGSFVTADFGNSQRVIIHDGNDTIYGGAGDDRIYGDNLVANPRYLSEGGSDTLHGNRGNDVMSGQEKDDTLSGGDWRLGPLLDLPEIDNDTLDGGDGLNEVRQTVDATSMVLTNTSLTGQGTDRLIRIQKAVLTGGVGANTIDARGFDTGFGVTLYGLEGHDTLYGTSYGDELWGGAGNDRVHGLAGDDSYRFETLRPGDTDVDDRIEDTAGFDTLDFSSMSLSDGLIVRLGASPIIAHSGRTVQSITPTNFEKVIGTRGRDELWGNNLDNYLVGGDGPDLIVSGGGNDTLDGGRGADYLVLDVAGDSAAGTGRNTLVFEEIPGYVVGQPVEVDMLYASTPDTPDTLDFSRLSARSPVSVNLGAGFLASHPGRELRTNTLGTKFNVLGGAGDDVFIEGPRGSVLQGGLGNDRYRLGAASENSRVIEQADGGSDTLDFSVSPRGVVVGLNSATILADFGPRVVFGNGQFIENVEGSEFGDQIVGNNLNNWLNGRGGTDLIIAGAGDDTLTGGDGNDSLIGQSGSDRYQFAMVSTGVRETDTISEALELNSRDSLRFSYLPASQGVSVSLDPLDPYAFHALRDIVINGAEHFEIVEGGAGSDYLQGNALDNELYGLGGNDILIGADGDDWLAGGTGNDTYRFGTATSEEVDEVVESVSEGIDVLSFLSLTTELTVNLSANPGEPIASHAFRTVLAGTSDSAIHLENILGGDGPNWLIGNAQANYLRGGLGVDTLEGRGGEDTLDGRGGDNRLIGGNHSDTYVLSRELSGLNSLYESEGTSVMGKVAVGGEDTLDFSFFELPVTMSLASVDRQALIPQPDPSGRLVEIQLFGAAEPDSRFFENVIGVAGAANHLTGNESNNILIGGTSTNALIGNGGSDILLGGGTDELVGGAGPDILIGGLGTDRIQGEEGEDILIGGRVAFGDESRTATLRALANVRAIWSVDSLSFDERVDRISTGNGVANGTRLALNTTVMDDAAPDELTGGPEPDWFLTFPNDTVLDPEPAISARSAAGGAGSGNLGTTGGSEDPPAFRTSFGPADGNAPSQPMNSAADDVGRSRGDSDTVNLTQWVYPHVQLVVVSNPSQANSAELPASLTQVAMDQTFYVEAWLQERGFVPGGLSGGFVDLAYDSSLLRANSVLHADFPLLTDGRIDHERGIVDDLGGARFGDGHGTAPAWTRLALVEMQAQAFGGASLSLSPGKFPFAQFGRGNIAWSNVSFGDIAINVVGRDRCLVTTTADTGPGSLREALNCANGSTFDGQVTVTFAIPETDPGFVDVDSHLPDGDAAPDVFVISPQSPLPAITRGAISIAGESQLAVSGDSNPLGPEIVLAGHRAGVGATGLELRSANNRVHGVNIQQFFGNGILISGNGNTVSGSHLGTDPTGSSTLVHGIPAGDVASTANRGHGIVIESGRDNLIGGGGELARNIISGNLGSGVTLSSAGTVQNRVQGNFIGTTATGEAALPNAEQGVQVIQGAANNEIGTDHDGFQDDWEGNLISGNRGDGIRIHDLGSNGNRVRGNRIGTNLAGTDALGNVDGIAVLLYSTGNQIGGLTAVERNVISGNRHFGVVLASSFSDPAQRNLVQGNYIGTDWTGMAPVGNFTAGVALVSDHSGVIGGVEPGAGNVISGNGPYGIWMYGGNGNRGVRIQGNLIGTTADQSAALPNWRGIEVNADGPNSATDVLIGGTDAAAGNVISGNSLHGLQVIGSATSGLLIQGNAIGTTRDGAQVIPNAGSGVWLDHATGLTLGGTTAGSGNRINGNLEHGVHLQQATGIHVVGNTISDNAGKGILISESSATAVSTNVISCNGQDGVAVVGNSSQNNTIRWNTIDANGGEGIDLGDNGITANDLSVSPSTLADADQGPNQLQNFPSLSSARRTPNGANAGVNVQGVLHSTPRKSFVVDLYLSPSGARQGSQWLAAVEVTTNAEGTANVSFKLPLSAAAVGQHVVATATEIVSRDGTAVRGPTSEFSSPTKVNGQGGGGNGGGNGNGGGKPLLAAALPVTSVTDQVNEDDLGPMMAEARSRWQAAGVSIPAAGLITVAIADLPAGMLGWTEDYVIWIDDDAAGWGWYVDPTPEDDSEFSHRDPTLAPDGMDLLTVVMHELGHLLGREHTEHGVLRPTLEVGVREGTVDEEPSATTVHAIDHLFSDPGFTGTPILLEEPQQVRAPRDKGVKAR